MMIGVSVAVLAYSRTILAPTSAPREVQLSGIENLRAILSDVAESPFGRSARGRALTQRIESALQAGKITFSTEISGRAAHRTPLVGGDTWYIMVLEMNHGRFLHQAHWQLAEVIYHEAVHNISGGVGHGSIEEECDAFAAGLQAEHVMRDAPPPTPLIMDGLPVADFVRQKYARLSSSPDYQPVGTTLTWLQSATELNTPR
jgi:hypothetical protein